MLAELASAQGDKLLYELGRQNLEIATAPGSRDFALGRAHECLEILYRAAAEIGAKPCFAPVLATDEDLLAIPDERDASWLALDGRPALNLLARTSSVQVTVDVPIAAAISMINRLWAAAKLFAADYPQDALWRRYVTESSAPYRLDRYAGPNGFDDLAGYCRELVRHDVVMDTCLVPHEAAGDYDLAMFVRSVWWWFRLRRLGQKACVEIRPMPRRRDEDIGRQIDEALGAALI
jgi:hypothetical protein